ncbi:hypothetical protein J6590_041364 [Homalodisca vitripennis]|nr:hypothetical protein J6590_041364 [Homalodisca vitripennis]
MPGVTSAQTQVDLVCHKSESNSYQRSLLLVEAGCHVTDDVTLSHFLIAPHPPLPLPLVISTFRLGFRNHCPVTMKYTERHLSMKDSRGVKARLGGFKSSDSKAEEKCLFPGQGLHYIKPYRAFKTSIFRSAAWWRVTSMGTVYKPSPWKNIFAEESGQSLSAGTSALTFLAGRLMRNTCLFDQPNLSHEVPLDLDAALEIMSSLKRV